MISGCEFCGQPSVCTIWKHRACVRCCAAWQLVADKELPAKSSPESHQAFTDQLVKRAKAKRGAA
jgi:hypothetical protein